MVICISILLVSLLIMLPIYPRRIYWKWVEILMVLLCSLYFFYTPNQSEDLYRYYQVMDAVRYSNVSTILVNTYMQETPLFLVYAKILSPFSNNVLPVITGIISLFLYIKLIKKAFPDTEGYHWQIAMSLIALLFLVRFIDITGIRNILAASIFSIAIYDDLVEHKKTSVLLYVIAALIHSTILLYLVIRVILWIYYRYSKAIIIVLLFISSTLIANFSGMLAQFFSWNPTLNSLFSRLMLYMNNGSGMGVSLQYKILYTILYLFIVAFVLCYESRFDIDGKYKKLSNFVVLLIIFTFSFINQRELFNRPRMVLIPLGIFFFAQLLKEISGRSPISFVMGKNLNYKFSYLFSAVLVYSFFFFTIICFVLMVRSDYSYFNQGFGFLW